MNLNKQKVVLFTWILLTGWRVMSSNPCVVTPCNFDAEKEKTTSAEKTFTINPYRQKLIVNYAYAMQNQNSYGIDAAFKENASDDAYASVKVYLSNIQEGESSSSIGPILYGFRVDKTTSEANPIPNSFVNYPAEIKSIEELNNEPFKYKRILGALFNSSTDNTWRWRSNEWERVLLKLKTFDGVSRYKVVIELSFKDVSIHQISLPGFNPMDLKDIVPIHNWYHNPCESDSEKAGCQEQVDFIAYNSDDNKKTLVVAHRGFHGNKNTPENSMTALNRAYENKFRYTELDLRMTSDNVPIIFHDDYLGYTTNFPYPINNKKTNTQTEKRSYNTIKDLCYRNRYWDGNDPILITNSKGDRVKYAELSIDENSKITRFEEVCKYIQDKSIFVFLDIKSQPMERHFQNLSACIVLAAKYNVLHQIGIKVIRTNNKPTVSTYLNMTVDNMEKSLGSDYNYLKNHLNIHICDYKPGGYETTEEGEENDIPDTFITNWIAEGNVIGIELDHQFNPVFNSPPMKPHDSYKYNGSKKSPWEYTKLNNIRTGIWSSTALDARGRPGHDPSSYSTGNAMKIDNNSNWQDFQVYRDNRARMEFINMFVPGYITHDRPDMVVNYLDAIGKLNPKTFR